MSCPVCVSGTRRLFGLFEGNSYWHCATCLATGLDPAHFLSAEQEKAQYDFHQNDPDDPGYRKFLSRLATPLVGKLIPGSKGLDYGCGPGPALARMLSEAGHTMALYDPFYYPDDSVFAQSYDFITCTEVAEHFHSPAAEFARLDTLLRPGGWLAIMTSFMVEEKKFLRWRYRMDPTHVVFYRQQTFEHIAQMFGWTCECPSSDIILMGKPAITTITGSH